jgi:hypothetical protein
MSILYAKRGRDEISSDAFAAEYGHLTAQLHEWRDNLDPALKDPRYLVTDFNPRRPQGEDSIINPYAPGYLYEHPLFSTTILLCEWHSIMVMHKSQEGLKMQQEPTPELRSLAFGICHTGVLIILQACLAIATLFIPRDMKHHMWMRRKFAYIEALG